MNAPRLGRHARLLSQHVDGLELTCAVESVRLLLGDDGCDLLEMDLAEVQNLARAQAPQCAVESVWRWGDCDDPVIVHPGGFRPGTRYCIECSDWMAFIAPAYSATPRFTVQCRAEYLCRVGAIGAFDQVKAWFETQLVPLVGGRPNEDTPRWRISRLDLAADVMGVNFSIGRLPHFTTRAKARNTYNDEPESTT